LLWLLAPVTDAHVAGVVDCALFRVMWLALSGSGMSGSTGKSGRVADGGQWLLLWLLAHVACAVLPL
jgi:hypothetical protein